MIRSQRSSSTIKTLAAIVPFVVLAVTSRASASGNAVARFGGEHGTVVATNPTALFYNPGGIAFSEGMQLYLDGQLAIRSLSWTHSMAPTDAPEPAGFTGVSFGTARALNVFGAPMLGGTIRFGDFVIGAAGYAPFGGSVHFDRNDALATSMLPYTAEGIARWHGYEAFTASFYGTVGIAYRLGPVGIGVTGNGIFTTLTLDKSQSVGSGLNDARSEGRNLLDVTGLNGSIGVGVMVEAAPNTLWIGASYQTQPGFGPLHLDGTLTLGMNGMLSAPRDVTFQIAYPDIVRLGARLRPSEKVELRIAGDMTRWSLVETHCLSVRDKPCTVLPTGAPAPGSGVVQNLERKYDDTFGVRGGGSYWVVPEFEAFVGAGFETASAPDSSIDPVLADANNLAAALGGRLQVAGTWFIALSYTHLHFFERNNIGKSTLSAPLFPTRRPDGGGIYKQWVGIINTNITKSF